MLLSQEGIGDVIGLSAPHVNCSLAELKRDGLIATSGREVRIRGTRCLTCSSRASPDLSGEVTASPIEALAIRCGNTAQCFHLLEALGDITQCRGDS